jgi:hypothetical protein
LSTVNQLRGVNYDWTDSYLHSHALTNLPKGDTGVIAQEVLTVFPQVVASKENGDLGVKYDKFAGLFIEAIKELSAKVDSLQAELNALKNSSNV